MNQRVLNLLWAAALLLSVTSARAFYNPTTGRWLSRDPIGERGGAHLYAFALNCPTLRYDLLGRETKTFQTYDGFSYQVTVDVAPDPIFGLCIFHSPASLLIPISIKTSDYDPRSSEYPQTGVLLTVDEEAVGVTLSTSGGSESIFSGVTSKRLQSCPKGLQKGSVTVTGQYHDDNFQTTWVTAFAVVINWTYKCKCDCLGGYDQPFKTTFTWTGNKRPE